MKTCWYEDGLAFECQGCSHCCRGPGGYVWLSMEEACRIAAHLNMKPDDFGRKYLRQVKGKLALVDGAGGDCVLLGEDGRCEVYELRPTQCRTFPWWPEVVDCKQSWENEKRNCPGFDQGRIFTPDEIQKALAEND
jgi:Fe-S-cluster containining protein